MPDHLATPVDAEVPRATSFWRRSPCAHPRGDPPGSAPAWIAPRPETESSRKGGRPPALPRQGRQRVPAGRHPGQDAGDRHPTGGRHRRDGRGRGPGRACVPRPPGRPDRRAQPGRCRSQGVGRYRGGPLTTPSRVAASPGRGDRLRARDKAGSPAAAPRAHRVASRPRAPSPTTPANRSVASPSNCSASSSGGASGVRTTVRIGPSRGDRDRDRAEPMPKAVALAPGSKATLARRMV